MAITLVAPGAVSDGTGSCTPGYAASIAAGDLIILLGSCKYPPNSTSTPSGFTFIGQASGGSGAGVDSGACTAFAYYKIAVGGETGTFTLTATGTNVVRARTWRLTKAAGETWDISGPSVGTCTAATTSWSVTGDVALDLTARDLVIATTATNTDNYTHTSELVAASGVTFGTSTERNDIGSFVGEDCGFVASDHVVTTGAGSPAVPTYTMTSSGSSAGVSPMGATVMFRIRAYTNATGSIGTVTLSTVDGSATGAGGATNGSASGDIGTVAIVPADGSASGTSNVSASGTIGTVTLTSPEGTGATTTNAYTSGDIGTVTVTSADGTASGAVAGSASGTVGTVTLSSPDGSATATASAAASGAIGTITMSPCLGYAGELVIGLWQASSMGIGVGIGF